MTAWGPCNGVSGMCVEAVHCPGRPLAGRCSGPASVFCCRQLRLSAAQSRGPLPGVGRPCVGVEGTCLDPATSECSAGFVSGRCVGAAALKCCPSGTPDRDASVNPLTVDNSNDVTFTDLAELQGARTFHIGDTLAIQLPVEVDENEPIKAYLWETATLTKPSNVSVMLQHGMGLKHMNKTHVTVQFATLLDRSPIDQIGRAHV